jgi:Cu2+-exporting ATPase
VVLVRPGSRVPADGVVVEGTAEVDESLITGESRAIPKATGSAVVGGTVSAGGSLRVRVRATGEETKLLGIIRLVAAAQASGSRAQALADRAAALLFYIAVGTGTLTFAYWWMAGVDNTPSSDRPPYSSLLARMRLGLQSRWRLRFQQPSAHAMVCS